MNLAINDRRTFNLTLLFVILGAAFGVLVALLSLQFFKAGGDNVLLLDRGGEGIIIVLNPNEELANALQTALEEIRQLERLQADAPIPADNWTIVPPKSSSSEPVFIDI